MDDRLSSEQWSLFWEKGTPTTFLGRYANNYDGEVKAFWDEQFASLPEDAAIVDFGTGNGALAVLAAQHGLATGRNLQVVAIDYADIDPADLVLPNLEDNVRERIEFRSQCSMEDTGLPDARFDAVISQFGFEYGDPGKTVEEASRLLKPDACIFLLLHREGSAIHTQALDGLKEVEYCEASSLHELVTRLLTRLDEIGRSGGKPESDPEAETLREQINGETGQLHDLMEKFEDPAHLSYFVLNTMAVFRPQFARQPLEDRVELLAQVAEETAAYASRMRDLLSAVRSPAQIDELEQLLGKAGFKTQVSEGMDLPEGQFCHKLIAKRTAR